MKKIALLLGALSLISAAAYAEEAPSLQVTYVGQSLEVDNASGGANVGEDVHFGNSLGLEYGDWSFDLFARKTWSMDTDDGIHSSGSRIDLDVWRNFENYSLGFRWRHESELDGYYLRTQYEYGAFSGWIDAAYYSNNGAEDKEDDFYVEAQPINFTFGPLTVGYYFEADTWAVNTKEDGFEHNYRQQLRFSAPIYTGEKLSLGLEYRWQFDTDTKYDKEKLAANGDFTNWVEPTSNTHIVVLSASYAVTDSLTIDGYYQYDMKKYDSKGTGDAYADDQGEDDGKYYGEFYVGWTYTF